MKISYKDAAIACCEAPRANLTQLATQLAPKIDDIKRSTILALGLENLIPELQEELIADKFSVCNAASLAKLPKEEQLLLWSTGAQFVVEAALTAGVQSYLSAKKKKCTTSKKSKQQSASVSTCG